MTEVTDAHHVSESALNGNGALSKDDGVVASVVENGEESDDYDEDFEVCLGLGDE